MSTTARKVRGRVDLESWMLSGGGPVGKTIARETSRAIDRALTGDGLNVTVGWNRAGSCRDDPLRLNVDLPLGSGDGSDPRFDFSIKFLASDEFVRDLVDCEELPFGRKIVAALRSLADRLERKIQAAPRDYGLCEDTLQDHAIPIGSSKCLHCGYEAAARQSRLSD